MVLLNPTEILPRSEISRIIGAFCEYSRLQQRYPANETVATTFVGWVVTFALCYSVVGAVEACRKLSPHPSTCSNGSIKSISAKSSSNGSEKMTDIQSATTESLSQSWGPIHVSLVDLIIENWSIIVPLVGTFVFGVPFAAVQKDHRPLDMFVLWFIWIGTVKCQRWLKKMASRSINRRIHLTILATLTNPVLFSTFLMLAYTRAEAAIIGGQNALGSILHMFSSGTPLYALWTALTNGHVLSQNPSGWFGAGDVALSALECGIVIWGFKLFECRRQLVSLSGLCTVLLCIAAAAANVFLSVLLGKVAGLGPKEALAFAARNTTLALSRPSMATIGGNTVVNAALVVSNGILGQLLYPFIMDKVTCSRLSFALDKTTAAPEGLVEGSNSSEMTLCFDGNKMPSERDDIMTVATGVTVGINGAAMGVSYLYENKSRSAPYAALAMTVYGVMTVIFTTVGPFKALVESLAH